MAERPTRVSLFRARDVTQIVSGTLRNHHAYVVQNWRHADCVTVDLWSQEKTYALTCHQLTCVTTTGSPSHSTSTPPLSEDPIHPWHGLAYSLAAMPCARMDRYRRLPLALTHTHTHVRIHACVCMFQPPTHPQRTPTHTHRWLIGRLDGCRQSFSLPYRQTSPLATYRYICR